MQSPRHVVWPEWIESSGSPSTLPASGLPSGSIPSAEEIDLSIVIVNYNASALLSGCLASVFASAGDFSYTVCVVDNGSSDDSVAMMRDRFPQAGLILSETNLGFSAGNNLALRQLGLSERRPVPNRPLPRYTLLLNNDTVLPANALADMIQFMDGRPDLGVAGPRVRRPDGTLDLGLPAQFSHTLGELLPHDPSEPAVSPEQTIQRLQSELPAGRCSTSCGFSSGRIHAGAHAGDPGGRGCWTKPTFMYGEDLDWAKRIKSAGWEVWYNGEVEITHVKEASSRRSRKARRAFYEAMWIFYRKHYRANSSWMLDKLIWLSISLIGGVDIAIRLWKLRQKRI